MSDYFFYDINKKMADLANKQQLTEDAKAAPVKTASSVLRTQLNERDLGKHNNATTGFAALAKKTGGGEKGAKIAGAQLAKMRAKGQVEEEVDESALSTPISKAMKSGGTRSLPGLPMQPKSTDESAFQAAIGKKKYGDQGMKALQKAGRNHAGAATMNKIRNQYDKYDESMTDEGNAFSGAVVRAKADGIQPGEKIRVGGKQYPVREADATPQHVDDWTPPAKPAPKASAPKPPVAPKPAPKKPAMYPPQAIDDPVKEAAKWRHPKYKNRLYTQKKGDSDDYDDMDYGYDDYGIKKRPANDPGQKRRMGGVGNEFSRTDPLEKGFGRSGTGSPVEKGPRKGLPKRDQITSLKQSIKDVHGRHPEPNLPEGGVPMTPKQKSFAKLAPPVDKITFADKIVGAKKEVDEVLGDVAANAMKKAIQGRKNDMEESFWDDEPNSRKSSTGGRIDTTRPGVTRHHAGTSYSGAGHDVGADDEPTGALGRRRVGAGMGKKIGAKINRGTSKLMTREGDIDPTDQGEYDQEGSMAKDDIKTVVRHALALEKILGDNDNLPEWVQAKLAKIEGMMTAVDDYMQNQQGDEMETESTGSFSSGATNPSDPTPAEWAELKRKAAAGDTRAQAYVKQGEKRLTNKKYEPGTGDQTGNVAARTGTNLSPSAAGAGQGNRGVPDNKDSNEMDEESTNKRDSRAERAGRKVAKDIEYDEKKKDGIHGKRPGSEDSKAERAGRKVTKDIEWDEKHKKNESSDQHFDKGYYDSIDAAKKDNPKSIVKARKQPFEEESTNTRDSRAEKAGRKVAKDIEYDEKKKDGIHGQRRDSEDDKAERAGRKVTKDIEYDEKKDKKKKEVDETTSSGSVATGGAAPKSGGGVSYGKGIYDSLNREVEKMIAESMSINMSMNNDSHGGPSNTLTVTATDEDALQLAMLLKSAGLGSQEHGDMSAIHDMDDDMSAIHAMDHGHGDEPCPACGSSDCECDEVQEAYGDTDATQNEPDWPTDQEGTDDAMMYSGGLDGPKSTGQTTVPVIAGQHDRMGSDGDHELRRMMEIAGLR